MLFFSGLVFCACAHRPASFQIHIPQEKNSLVLEQELYRNWGSVQMGPQGRNLPDRKSYTFNFNLNEPELIRYAYLSIDCAGVERPENPVVFNGHPIGSLERGTYGGFYAVSYAGTLGPKKRNVYSRTQRYLPAVYFQKGENTLQVGHQFLRSVKKGGKVSYEKYTITNISLAVYKVRTRKGTPPKDFGKRRNRQFPDQFHFFKELTDEELYIALIKLPYLLAELSDPASEYANSISYVYSKIGDYYRWTGYYKKCLDYQTKASKIQSEQPLSFLTARLQTKIALAYYYVGDYHNAVSECEEALETIADIRKRDGFLDDSKEGIISGYLESMAYAYLSLNYYQLANESDAGYYARRVIREFNDDWGFFKNRRTQIGKYVPISLAHQTLGDYDLREKRFKEALKNYRKAESFLKYEVRPEIYHDQMCTIHLSIAKVLYHLGEYSEARRILGQIEDPTKSVMWRSYLLQGLMAEAEKDLKQAIRLYLEAIKEIEFSRTRLTSHGLKINFMTDKQEPYSRMVHCLVKLNRTAEAFDYAEKAKARAFLDLIAETDKIIGQKNEALTELTLEEKRLREALLDVQHQADMARQMFNDRGNSNDTRQQMAEARGALGAFFSRWFRKNKDFASLRSAQTLGISDVQKLIPAEAAVVEYFYHGKTLFAWVITRNSFRIVQKPIAEAELVALVKTYRSLVARPDRVRGLSLVRTSKSSNADQKTFVETNHRLRQVLVDDVMHQLSSEKIYIVPHGILHYLPFQALFHDGHYLIERYQIGYTPSASVLRYVLDERKSKAKRIFALGNPDLGSPQMDLPHAEKEVHDIRQWFSGAKVVTRDNATEANFKKYAADFDILHIASHGEFNIEAPLLSCLRLGSGENEDGRLETQEIFDLDLDAYLVSLSACNTALGKMTKGDELMGLTRAFIYAGTPSILGTFWSVNDESTQVIMGHFYANLKTMDKFQSMQKAQLAMIQDQRFQHPYFWAGFQMIGDYR